MHPLPDAPTQPHRLTGWLVLALLVLPWIHPWAPGPQPNTVPLLIGWGTLALLLAMRRWPSARQLAQAWACAAVISSAMGLLQYFGQATLLEGWLHVPVSVGEAQSNLRQRNQLATLTSIGAAAVLWWHAQGLRTAHALGMLALLALGNAATSSRTGLLQWLLLPVLLGLWQGLSPKRRPVWAWSALLWALGVYLVGNMLLPHALATWRGVDISNAVLRMAESGGCGSRAILWSNMLHLIGQHPWTGWGWGALKYAHYMADYTGPRFCDILGNAHNLPLHMAFVIGIPATVLILGVGTALLLRARPWRLAQTNNALAWGVLLPIGLHSLLEYPLWYSPFQLAVVWSVLLLWPSAHAAVVRAHRGLQVVGVGAVCLLALVAWDYQRMRQIYLPQTQRSAPWQRDPWSAARQTWFFGDAVRFAQVTSVPVTPHNAQAMLEASLAALHYSPEPRVIDPLIASARLRGQDTLAQWHQAQKQAVYGPPAH